MNSISEGRATLRSEEMNMRFGAVKPPTKEGQRMKTRVENKPERAAVFVCAAFAAITAMVCTQSLAQEEQAEILTHGKSK